MRLRCLLADCTLPDDVLIDQPAKLMRDHADSTVAPSGLCGTGSRNLQFALSNSDQLERFKLVLQFFGVWPDLDELFGVLDTHIRGTPSASDAKVRLLFRLHISLFFVHMLFCAPDCTRLRSSTTSAITGESVRARSHYHLCFRLVQS
jgi:hypothetical protein